MVSAPVSQHRTLATRCSHARSPFSLQVTALVRAAKEALAARPPELRPPPGLEKPLVRLKVEHSGFHTLPNAR